MIFGSLFHSVLHRYAPIIGVTRKICPTSKKNNGGFYLEGMWILRWCTTCDEIFTRDGMEEMIGKNKHAVRVGPSLLFVEGCRNGCAPEDLYVVIDDGPDEAPTLAKVKIGCNFCKISLTRAKVSSALSAWETAQQRPQSPHAP